MVRFRFYMKNRTIKTEPNQKDILFIIFYIYILLILILSNLIIYMPFLVYKNISFICLGENIQQD